MSAGRRHAQRDTIAALASAADRAERAVLRVSGPGSYAILARLAGASAALPERGGRLLEVELALPQGRLPATLWCFRAPRSYTGDDLIELHVIGWPVLVHELLRALQREGARLARPGEFTQRAFLAGKLDLAQCSAVLRLTSARDREVSRAAAGLLELERGESTSALRDELLSILAFLGAHLDFEEVEVAGAGDELARRARELRERIAKQRARWEALPAARERPWVALLGRPSVGKSTLFNRWVGEERALVDEAPGTTRDLLRATARLDGLEVELVDQPGRAGERADAREAALLRSADLLLCCVDAAAPELPAELPDHPRRFLVHLRADRLDGESPSLVTSEEFVGRFLVSVQREDGLAALERALAAALRGDAAAGEGTSGVELEQRDALRAAEEHVGAAELLLRAGLPYEIAAEELRSALAGLDRIAGSWSPEDLLDRIFARFCLGK
ncbi:MAG: 50S ribosome-binding GTPase [Planctomycetes bacterium]|nr:50S ribosome-binding GTPase [Planctomycetota bacterium]